MTGPKIKFLLTAEREFIDAVKYYNSQSAGLGFEFAAEVKYSLNRIIQYPLAWHKLSERTHRCRTNRFPYGVIYQPRKDYILIIAIMHLHRSPDTWQAIINNLHKK
ncbi:MAG: plasmid stabilization protein [Elusimicrobia bacterium RIFOXYA2_FULL_40_6]|nr:MAG: plasmid stabilization protein [Elusimicrobia bacterium RIFOXYA2_FULL_40_6]